MARKAGYGSRRGPVRDRGRTCVFWVLILASDLAEWRWAFEVPTLTPAGQPPGWRKWRKWMGSPGQGWTV